MKTIDTLTDDNYIAFLYQYSIAEDLQVEVAKITHVYKEDNEVLVHFNVGHHSVGEFIKMDDIIAIGDNENGTIEFKGWNGKFRLLKDKNTLTEYIDG